MVADWLSVYAVGLNTVEALAAPFFLIGPRGFAAFCPAAFVDDVHDAGAVFVSCYWAVTDDGALHGSRLGWGFAAFFGWTPAEERGWDTAVFAVDRAFRVDGMPGFVFDPAPSATALDSGAFIRGAHAHDGGRHCSGDLS